MDNNNYVSWGCHTAPQCNWKDFGFQTTVTPHKSRKVRRLASLQLPAIGAGGRERPPLKQCPCLHMRVFVRHGRIPFTHPQTQHLHGGGVARTFSYHGDESGARSALSNSFPRGGGFRDAVCASLRTLRDLCCVAAFGLPKSLQLHRGCLCSYC